MIQPIRRLFYMNLIAWFLISCQTEVDMTQLKTQTSTPVLSSTYVVSPTTTSLTITSTPSPFPEQIATLLPSECEQLGINVYSDFSWQYGDKGCKLPILSPNGKYLAYVTLTQQGSKPDINFVDVLRVLEVGTNAGEKEVRVVPRLDYIEKLEWSPTGQLIIWESIWEGPWVVFIYDPATDKILVTMRADRGTALQWNPQHTAFYVSRGSGYGPDNCVKELGGYDFESGSRFPNLYEVFDVETKNDNPFGIPYGVEDNLYIEPFGWSLDGKHLWLTVMLLRWKGDGKYEYEVGPSQAGVIEISATGVMYKLLAADTHLDYFFEGLPDLKFVSRIYQSRICPEQ